MVGRACLFVPAETGRQDSPIFWLRHSDWRRCSAVNGFRVDLFGTLLGDLQRRNPVPPAAGTGDELRKALERRIAAIEGDIRMPGVARGEAVELEGPRLPSVFRWPPAAAGWSGGRRDPPWPPEAVPPPARGEDRRSRRTGGFRP